MKESLLQTLLPLTLLAAACASAPTVPAMPPVLERGGPPIAADAIDSRWGYLRQRYDADADGVVRADEYDRAGGHFDRLDSNGDGLLDASDFASGEGMQARMSALRQRMFFARLFQADDDSEELALFELDWRVTELDQDGDDRLVRSELERGAAELELLPSNGMAARMLDGVVPWDVLGELDGDGDGALGRAELTAYFQSQSGGEDVLRLSRGRRPSRSEDDGEDKARAPETGPAKGTFAPDFALSAPAGGEPVRLSSFRDERPVALIFGSYT